MSQDAAYHNDMLQMQRTCDEALQAATSRPLTALEVAALRFAAGIPVRKEFCRTLPVFSSDHSDPFN